MFLFFVRKKNNRLSIFSLPPTFLSRALSRHKGGRKRGRPFQFQRARTPSPSQHYLPRRKKEAPPSKTHRRPELPRGRKVPHKRHELVLPAPVRRQLHAPYEPDLDAGVLEALARRRGDADLRILSFFLVEVEVKVEKKKRERAENDGKTIAMMASPHLSPLLPAFPPLFLSNASCKRRSRRRCIETNSLSPRPRSGPRWNTAGAARARHCCRCR